MELKQARNKTLRNVPPFRGCSGEIGPVDKRGTQRSIGTKRLVFYNLRETFKMEVND